MVEVITNLVAWFADPYNWQGPNGVPTRVLEHIYYSVLAIVVAAISLVQLHILRGREVPG